MQGNYKSAKIPETENASIFYFVPQSPLTGFKEQQLKKEKAELEKSVEELQSKLSKEKEQSKKSKKRKR